MRRDLIANLVIRLDIALVVILTRVAHPAVAPVSKRPIPSCETLLLIFEKLTKQEERLTSLEVKTAGETEIERPRSTADQRSEGEMALQNRGSEPGMSPCRPLFGLRGDITDSILLRRA